MLILFILSYFYTYPIGFYIFFQTTSGLLSQFSLTRLKIEEKWKKPSSFFKNWRTVNKILSSIGLSYFLICEGAGAPSLEATYRFAVTLFFGFQRIKQRLFCLSHAAWKVINLTRPGQNSIKAWAFSDADSWVPCH